MTTIDDIKARWAAATPGPWRSAWNVPDADSFEPHFETGWMIATEDGDPFDLRHMVMGSTWYDGPHLACREANATAIAAAPTDIAWMLARIADAEAERSQLRQALRDCVAALGNGGAIGEGASTEFHLHAPAEVLGVVAELRAERDTAIARVADAEAIIAAEVPIVAELMAEVTRLRGAKGEVGR